MGGDRRSSDVRRPRTSKGLSCSLHYHSANSVTLNGLGSAPLDCHVVAEHVESFEARFLGQHVAFSQHVFSQYVTIWPA
ncbi:unnamed protein product [Calypogeia fissa]